MPKLCMLTRNAEGSTGFALPGGDVMNWCSYAVLSAAFARLVPISGKGRADRSPERRGDAPLAALFLHERAPVSAWVGTGLMLILAYAAAMTSLLGGIMSVVRMPLPELMAPLAYGFVGDDDPTCEQQLSTIAITEADTEVQPASVVDTLCRAAVLLGRVG
jgi:hypothetical protein